MEVAESEWIKQRGEGEAKLQKEKHIPDFEAMSREDRNPLIACPNIILIVKSIY